MLIDRKKAIAYMALLMTGVFVFTSVKWLLHVRGIDLRSLAKKKQLINELTETIIPRTDTPGAKDANVADFIISMVTSGLPKTEQWTFLLGLEDVDKYSIRHFGEVFLKCSVAQRTKVLRYFERSEWVGPRLVQKIRNKLLGRSFFTLFRWLTVLGYCSSEAGATKALSYDFIPEVYKGCVPLEIGQKAWAIQ
ncbi:gluconate 2-dehydrogenase subunit 3 family protein [Parapedobacter sp. GCM10030251]|uniref:gluconate 2-dehydrogenase subunit 3 family protein n=1 Tax=Parapedobacter sp. GCM10030251 TaxID=3273419 RepID=UPI00360BA7F4